MDGPSQEQRRGGKPKTMRVRVRAPAPAQAPADDRLPDEPVSFLETGPDESVQAEGLPEFLEPTEAFEPPEPPEPPHCP